MQTTHDTGPAGFRQRYPRWPLLPIAGLLGGIGAVGFWRNDQGWMAIGLVVTMTLFGAAAAFSKGEFFVAGTDEGDERQRSIDMEAAQVAYICVIVVAVVGFMWEIYADRPGVFSFICFVGGTSHALAFAVLKRRR